MSETAAANAAYRRHDITDRSWETIAPHFSGGPGKVGRPAQNTPFQQRRILDPPPWRDLPPDYGRWNTAHRRFTRWQEDGHWARLLSEVSDAPDLEWLMIDASYVKVHQHGAGARGGNQAAGRKGG